jgi:hypothetical protein
VAQKYRKASGLYVKAWNAASMEVASGTQFTKFMRTRQQVISDFTHDVWSKHVTLF